jgi:threonine dehydratase
MNLTLASETFQATGSFQIRAAHNIVSSVSQPSFLTASYGNFGSALAYVCSLRKKSCLVLMPTTSSSEKVEAVREYGGQVELVDTKVKSLTGYLKERAAEHSDAYLVKSDDLLAIQGIASLGKELGSLKWKFDFVIAPIGVGALASGVIVGLRETRKNTSVIGAEPLLANDAARSLRAGEIVSDESEANTVADEARARSLGPSAWPILYKSLASIVEVPEEKIVEATRLLFALANLKVEPTGALGLAAVLTKPELFKGRSVCCIVSGANVDPGVYARMVLQKR